LSGISKIRLLIITPTLQCGGSERFVSMLCNHIDKNRFEVCLLVADNSKQFYRIIDPAVKIIDLQKNRVLFSLGSIKKAVKDFVPDILFSTANHLNLYLAIFRNHFSKKIKFIAREASIVSISSRQAKMPALYNRLIKIFYKRFDKVVCQSVYMQQDLVTHYNIPVSKTQVIYNAVEEVAVEVSNKENEQVYKLLTVARLSFEKGIERLIHAVGLLSVPFQYHIIGEGNKRTELQQLIHELGLGQHVFLHGQRAHAFENMEDADLLLVGSYYEGFPNVALEAGVRGIPVIAFNVPGGIAEIIHEENGMLIDDNDLIAFAAAVNRALLGNFNRKRIREQTVSKFPVKKMTTAIESLFLNSYENK
jgi:glycosyltransferase involved in cell wall biosynthesis